MRAAAASLAACALLVVVACGRGTPSNTPGAVADRFLDLYLIEVDQQSALALTTGAARSRIETEIADTAGVRATGYGPDAAKPRAFYERTMLREDEQAGSARAVYDIRLKMAGVETHRHALLSLSKRDGGAWKVSSFTLQDGPARSQ